MYQHSENNSISMMIQAPPHVQSSPADDDSSHRDRDRYTNSSGHDNVPSSSQSAGGSSRRGQQQEQRQRQAVVSEISFCKRSQESHVAISVSGCRRVVDKSSKEPQGATHVNIKGQNSTRRQQVGQKGYAIPVRYARYRQRRLPRPQ